MKNKLGKDKKYKTLDAILLSLVWAIVIVTPI